MILFAGLALFCMDLWTTFWLVRRNLEELGRLINTNAFYRDRNDAICYWHFSFRCLTAVTSDMAQCRNMLVIWSAFLLIWIPVVQGKPSPGKLSQEFAKCVVIEVNVSKWGRWSGKLHRGTYQKFRKLARHMIGNVGKFVSQSYMSVNFLEEACLFHSYCYSVKVYANATYVYSYMAEINCK